MLVASIKVALARGPVAAAAAECEEKDAGASFLGDGAIGINLQDKLEGRLDSFELIMEGRG